MKKKVNMILCFVLLTAFILCGAVHAAFAETPERIDQITFRVQDDLQCTATNVPELIGIADMVFMQQFKFYYQQDTTFSFNKDVTLSAYTGTAENKIIEIPANTVFRASDYVSWSGSYSPEAGTIVADSDFAIEAGSFMFAIADVQYYEKNVEEGNAFVSMRNYEVIAQGDLETAFEHYNKGIELAQDGQYEDALAEFTVVLTLNPQHAGTYIERGLVLFNLGRLEDAVADYTKAIELNPEHGDAYLRRGNALRDLDRCGEALIDYDKAIALIPEAWGYNYARGYLFAKHMDRYDEAVVDFNRAIELNQDFKFSYQYRAYALIQLGRYEEALADIDKALAIGGNAVDLSALRGDAVRGLAQYADAQEAYEEAIALDGQRYISHEAYAGRASLYMLDGAYDDALTDLDTALSSPTLMSAERTRYLALRSIIADAQTDTSKADGVTPFWPDAVPPFIPPSAEDKKEAEKCFNTGVDLYKEGKFEEAFAAFTQAAELNSQYVDAFYRRAMTSYAMKEYEKAFADFGKTIVIDPHYQDASYYRAFCLIYLERREEAIREFGKAIESYPDDAINWMCRGDTYYMLARYEEALADYEAAANVYLCDRKWSVSNLVQPYYRQGKALTKLGRDADAETVFARALQVEVDSDKSSYPYVYKARVLNHLGRYEEALRAVEKAIEISHSSSINHATLGDALRGLGLYDEARQAYDTSIETVSRQFIAYAGRAALAATTGEYETALAEIDHANAISCLDMDKAEYHSIRSAIVKAQSDPMQVGGITPYWPEAIAGPTRIGTVMMTAASNVRAEDNADSVLVGKVNKGESFDCTERADNGWYRIVLPNGTEGYVSPKMGKLTLD